MHVKQTFKTERRWALLNAAARYGGATLSVVLLSMFMHWLNLSASVANVCMLYLLSVIGTAVFLGRGAAVWAAICSFLVFNWFFVEPRFTFIVHRTSDWIALCMFLVTAMVTGQLMALLRDRERVAVQHQRQTAALAEASWAIASRLDSSAALQEVLRQIARVVPLHHSAILLFTSDGPITVAELPSGTEARTWSDAAVKAPVSLGQRDLGYAMLEPADTISNEQWRIIKSLLNYSAVVLERDELIKAQTKAAALLDADRLKTALLSMVSHDLRSPLTSIKASISALNDEGEPMSSETQRALYQAIEQETDRLNRLVGNVLDLSRLDAQAWRSKLEAMTMSELIGMTLDSFSDQENERIDVVIESEVPDVFVDPVQMSQVMHNLIENALKYSPPQSRVEITVSRRDESIVLNVMDRGRGLAASETEKIFERFYRSADLRESAIPGLGIGLAVCKGLVEAHGGRLYAQSREGGGATFVVELPLKQNLLNAQENRPHESACG